MITLNFLEFDDKTMVSWYSIKFDPGTSLETMLNDIQELEQNGKCHGVGTVQIYKDKELYDELIVEVKYIGGICMGNILTLLFYALILVSTFYGVGKLMNYVDSDERR